jgi:uncharacterized protein YunC (DUF1805 family)
MSLRHLQHRQEVISTDVGDVLGVSYRWPGGQYCALHTDRGIVGCGLYDVSVGTKFGMAIAIARGTPEHPLFEPEDLLEARIAEVSEAAEALGVSAGMTGREALERLLTPRGVPASTAGPARRQPPPPY